MGAAVAELTSDARAAAGATWCDEWHPDWWRHMDTDTLDVGTSECCPLGQIYGTWDNAPEQVAMDARLGFYRATEWPTGGVTDTAVQDTLRAIRVEYAALTAAWVAEIERRRAEAGAA